MTRESIKLLLDEHIWEGLTKTLVQQGYDVVHIVNTEHRGIDDETLLALAAAEDRAVLTFNVRDFAPLVRLWYESGREHAGVIFSVQLPQGELLRQIQNLLIVLSAEDLKNTARWLQEFK
jgi:predicted nuclease of predicted toxin-antitoxin system